MSSYLSPILSSGDSTPRTSAGDEAAPACSSSLDEQRARRDLFNAQIKANLMNKNLSTILAAVGRAMSDDDDNDSDDDDDDDDYNIDVESAERREQGREKGEREGETQLNKVKSVGGMQGSWRPIASNQRHNQEQHFSHPSEQLEKSCEEGARAAGAALGATQVGQLDANQTSRPLYPSAVIKSTTTTAATKTSGFKLAAQPHNNNSSQATQIDERRKFLSKQHREQQHMNEFTYHANEDDDDEEDSFGLEERYGRQSAAASASAASTRVGARNLTRPPGERNNLQQMLQSAASKREKMNKKLRQILQSIPMVPLVATTSLMTLLLVGCLLILSNPWSSWSSQAIVKFASASSEQRPVALAHTGEAREARDLHALAALDQGAPNEESHQFNDALLSGGGGGGGANQDHELAASASGAQRPAAASLISRELLDGLFVHPGARGGGAHVPHSRSHTHTRRPLGGKRQSGAAPADELERASLSGQTDEELAAEQQAAAMDSALSAMLLSAGPQMLRHQAQQQQQQQAAALFDEPTAVGAEGLPPAPLDMGPPAHLRSSDLTLELSEQPQLNLSQPQQQQATHRPPAARHRQPATAAAAAAQQQQQPQHEQQYNVNNKHHLSNHERPFDVLQVQCNNTDEGFERFACPTPDRFGRYRCIEDRLFCDGYNDCPRGEDEDKISCMYYKLNQNRQAAAAAASNAAHLSSNAASLGGFDGA